MPGSLSIRSRSNTCTSTSILPLPHLITMKLFTVLPAIGALVLGALSIVAQDAAAIMTGIDQVTDASRDLKTVVDQVTVANAPSQTAVSIPPPPLHRILHITDGPTENRAWPDQHREHLQAAHQDDHRRACRAHRACL